MSIEWFRDLVIAIAGLVLIGVLILFAILSYSLYRRARAILNSAKAVSKTIQDISDYAGGGVAKPLVQVVAIVQGIRQGVDTFSKIFKKKKGGGNG